MRLLVATTNRDKVREIRSLLADAPVELLTLGDVPPVAEPEETGDTFEANARIKASAAAKAARLPAFADDSGLAVDALGGAPGILSDENRALGTVGRIRLLDSCRVGATARRASVTSEYPARVNAGRRSVRSGQPEWQ